MRREQTLRQKVLTRMAEQKEDVFLPCEFSDLGGEDQVLRALRGLVRDGQLVRLGYGVYGRAFRSSLSGQPVLNSPDSFVSASRQALTKLGIQWEPTQAEKDYNERRSTQIPANAAVRIKGRFSRRLSYQGRDLIIER